MRVYGQIDGVPVGTTFINRRALAAAGVHRHLMAGICGGKDGAESVVVSGGYVDDIDNGDEVIYTGHGGNDPATLAQIADQEWRVGNAGLAANCIEGRPVRLVRGAHRKSRYAPPSGFRYDGLYRVDRY